MSRPVWATRRARAAQLLREAPHAEEMLVFYVALTEIQERVAGQVPVGDWLDAVRAPGDDPPLLRLERLPTDGLLPLFEDALLRVADVGTEVIAAGARELLDAEASERRRALAEPEGFHARAFLEPVMTALAAAHPGAVGGDPRRCFECGALPVVGVLRDLPDSLGSRSLVCSLCATEWRIDRLRCAHCGETEAEQLPVHTAESVPHARIDGCRTCEHYIKTVDLRRRGDAVPVVDELATVELDLWARERGLKKLRTNVLGL